MTPVDQVDTQSKPHKPAPWITLAACRGEPIDIWFPRRGESAAEAKAICATCPVRAECLNFAMSDPGEIFGIWGGTSEKERKRLRRNGHRSRQCDFCGALFTPRYTSRYCGPACARASRQINIRRPSL